MLPENALLESRVLRDTLAGRTDVLDKVKVLATLPDGLHATTEMIADYFEVDLEVIKKVGQRHREELTENGMAVLRGDDLRRFKRDSMSLYPAPGGESYPQARSNLTLWPRRAILNVAMLLRDSAVARRVRTHLLDVEEHERRLRPEPEPWAPGRESAGADIGDAVRQIGTVLHNMSRRLDSIDQRLTHTQRVVIAINTEVCALRYDVRRLDMRMDYAGLPQLPPDQRPQPPRPGRRPRRR